MIRKILFAFAAAATLAVSAPTIARADGYGYPHWVANGGPVLARDYVRGDVSYFNRFSMTVRVAGRDVPVTLHQGTVILPTGLTLNPGMYVGVNGWWEGGSFHADRIVLLDR
jgi:hypothetical protein